MNAEDRDRHLKLLHHISRKTMGLSMKCAEDQMALYSVLINLMKASTDRNEYKSSNTIDGRWPTSNIRYGGLNYRPFHRSSKCVKTGELSILLRDMYRVKLYNCI